MWTQETARGSGQVVHSGDGQVEDAGGGLGQWRRRPLKPNPRSAVGHGDEQDRGEETHRRCRREGAPAVNYHRRRRPPVCRFEEEQRGWPGVKPGFQAGPTCKRANVQVQCEEWLKANYNVTSDKLSKGKVNRGKKINK